jgi:hypothetical protein
MPRSDCDLAIAARTAQQRYAVFSQKAEVCLFEAWPFGLLFVEFPTFHAQI